MTMQVAVFTGMGLIVLYGIIALAWAVKSSKLSDSQSPSNQRAAH